MNEMDDQQLITSMEREQLIIRFAQKVGQEMSVRYDDAAYQKSKGNRAAYRKIMSQVWGNLQTQRQQQQQQSLANTQNDINRQNTSSPSGMMNQQQISQQQISQQQISQQQINQQQINQQQINQQQINQQQMMYQQSPSQLIQQQSMPPTTYVQQIQAPLSIIKQEPTVFNQQPQQSKQITTNKQSQQQIMPHGDQRSSVGGVHIKQEFKQEYMNNSNMPVMNSQLLTPMQQGQHVRQHIQPQNIQQSPSSIQTSQQQYPQQRTNIQQFPQIRQEMSTAMTSQQQTSIHSQQNQIIQQQQFSPQNSQLQQQAMNYQSQPSQQLSLSSNTLLTPQQQVQTVQQQNRMNILSSNQHQQPSNSSVQLQQNGQPHSEQTEPSPMQTNITQTAPTSTQTQQPADEILQQILSSPNPTKQTQNAQTRLRNMGRRAAAAAATNNNNNNNNGSPACSGSSPSVQMALTPGSDPSMMMTQNGSPQMMMGGSPMSRYMTGIPSSPQFRPNASPTNMINYGSPLVMADEEIQYYYRYFSERIRQLVVIINKLNQEGQYEKVLKLKQFHFEMSNFMKNPVVDNLIMARRLKEHFDRYMDPRIFGDMLLPRLSSTTGIFEQCYKAITDYLNKDSQHKASIAKRFLEPLADVVTGVPHKIVCLDSPKSVTPTKIRTKSETIEIIIENEFSQMPMDTYKYDLKQISQASSDHGYLLICRLIEQNMPIIPPLQMKISAKYPNECPEILSLTKTIPVTLTNYDGHVFFETIAKSFIYFLFKLPAQHTVTDILDIWRTSIRSALKECYFPINDDDSNYFE